MEEKYTYHNWQENLFTKWAGKNLYYYPELESTNITAGIVQEEDAPHGTLIVADKQTGGKGRRGRTWESPAGKNLYFSLILRPDFGLETVSMLTLVMAHSVARTIGEMTADAVNIKWPNDILIHGRKICGILTELKVEQGQIRHVVIGVGINVKKQRFEGELADKASSLEAECQQEISRKLLLSRIMEAFEADYERFAAAGSLQPFLEEYHSRLINMDAKVKVLDPKEPFEGIARGINPKGELIVEKCCGNIEYVYAGEVSVRGLHGYV